MSVAEPHSEEAAVPEGIAVHPIGENVNLIRQAEKSNQGGNVFRNFLQVPPPAFRLFPGHLFAGELPVALQIQKLLAGDIAG